MPFLFWQNGDRLERWSLDNSCTLGRDPASCSLAFPGEPTVSKLHASVHHHGNAWWVRDEDSRNGTLLNGLPVSAPGGNALEDGDEIRMGDVVIHYTETFPGLDPLRFVERVGDIFSEFNPEPAQTLVLVQGLELLHKSTENLLMESSASALIRILLEECVRMFSAERGFLLMLDKGGSWQTAHKIGNVPEYTGLSHSVLHYVSKNRTGVLSNDPLEDPRFGGQSLVELHRGALMCAPMEIDGQVQGILYVDRIRKGFPFSRFDLVLFQTLVHQGTLALRHARLSQKAIVQAEVEGEMMRLKSINERITSRIGEIFVAMESCGHWLKSYAERTQDKYAPALRHEIDRIQHLIEGGLSECQLEHPKSAQSSFSLEGLQGLLAPAWESLLAIRDAQWVMDDAPAGSIWVASNSLPLAVSALVEPMFMQVGDGQKVHAAWQEETGYWILRMMFPTGVHGPVPESWTVDTLSMMGVVWRWNEQTLSITFPRGLESVPDVNPLPLLGLVTEELELIGLFQSVAEAGGLALFPLEEDPPLPPLPHFRYLVVDALGVKDVPACIQAYRMHPNFATAPILVVRAPEETFSTLLAAGATDWLAEGFRWETLHHRLQVLKGHDDLQRRALASERLETFRQMAGSLKHEINNPLAIISMQVELLERKYPDEPKHAKIHEMVERIQALLQVLQKMREAPIEGYPDGSTILKLS